MKDLLRRYLVSISNFGSPWLLDQKRLGIEQSSLVSVVWPNHHTQTKEQPPTTFCWCLSHPLTFHDIRKRYTPTSKKTTWVTTASWLASILANQLVHNCIGSSRRTAEPPDMTYTSRSTAQVDQHQTQQRLDGLKPDLNRTWQPHGSKRH